MRIAVDTGGTFTDCVYVSNGELQILKLPSTPADPGAAVLQAVTQIASSEPAEVRHGTTVGTNTLLERKGARVAFITTEGFEDTIAIGRQARPKLYDLFFENPPPFAAEGMRFGVKERVTAAGEVLCAPDEDELERLRKAVGKSNPESIAISLLFGFANPNNEQAVAAKLRDLGVPVSVSHEILPEFREYERASTIVVNAYLAPRMQRYLETLDNRLRAQRSSLFVMQSSGGIVPASTAAREPVRTILSGPAGGVTGALAVGKTAGFPRLLTFDMGGTSTDVALVDSDAGLRTTKESQILSYPLAVPMLDIHTVGAGGGSLASFDRGGALQVGPQSAGADPGPICYGRGERATVTDANLLLGRIDEDWFLGGGMKLDTTRARTHFERIKGPLRSVEEFADGVIRVVNSHMTKALRRISVERGRDPRDFVLASFGGAGPLHACALARELRISRVVVPSMPGALSAYGIWLSDVVRDYSRTVMLQPNDRDIEHHFEALERRGTAEMREDGFEAYPVRSLDLRYVGQGYELTVDWSSDVVAQFHRLHEERFGYSDAQRPVQVVNQRVRMIAATESLPVRRLPGARSNDASAAVLKMKHVYFDNEWVNATVYDRAKLAPGDVFDGAAVIAEYSATTFVPPGCGVRVDPYGNLLIEIEI